MRAGFVRKGLLAINAIKGYGYKFLVDAHIKTIPPIDKRNSAEVVVSLTSYGRRVKTNVVYYTLVSLLRQDVQPANIVLWLAEDEWSDGTIPSKLRSLRGKGVDIRYCKDLKSYKKLIPSLKSYPESVIITVDDDMIYSKDTINALVSAHQSHPNEVICTVARKPIIKNGYPIDYSEWEDSVVKPFENGCSGEFLFPVGVGGVLYPAGSLNEDVSKEDVFLKCCPRADDIWFWFCGLRNRINKRYIIKQRNDLSFDSLFQFFHKGSALTHANNQEHQNDDQIRNLFEYYGLNSIEEITK